MAPHNQKDAEKTKPKKSPPRRSERKCLNQVRECHRAYRLKNSQILDNIAQSLGTRGTGGTVSSESSPVPKSAVRRSETPYHDEHIHDFSNHWSAKKFTPTRKKKVKLFMTLSRGNPEQYGDFQSYQWLRSLIEFLKVGKRKNTVVSVRDIKHWIDRFPQYFEMNSGESEPSSQSMTSPANMMPVASTSTLLGVSPVGSGLKLPSLSPRSLLEVPMPVNQSSSVAAVEPVTPIVNRNREEALPPFFGQPVTPPVSLARNADTTEEKYTPEMVFSVAFESSDEETMPNDHEMSSVGPAGTTRRLPKVEKEFEIIPIKFEEVPNLFLLKVEKEPELTPPKCVKEPELIPPKIEKEPELTPPKCVKEPELIPPKIEKEPELTPPQCVKEHELITPKIEKEPELTPPNCVKEPELITPKIEKGSERKEPEPILPNGQKTEPEPMQVDQEDATLQPTEMEVDVKAVLPLPPNNDGATMNGQIVSDVGPQPLFNNATSGQSQLPNPPGIACLHSFSVGTNVEPPQSLVDDILSCRRDQYQPSINPAQTVVNDVTPLSTMTRDHLPQGNLCFSLVSPQVGQQQPGPSSAFYSVPQLIPTSNVTYQQQQPGPSSAFYSATQMIPTANVSYQQQQPGPSSSFYSTQQLIPISNVSYQQQQFEPQSAFYPATQLIPTSNVSYQQQLPLATTQLCYPQPSLVNYEVTRVRYNGPPPVSNQIGSMNFEQALALPLAPMSETETRNQQFNVNVDSSGNQSGIRTGPQNDFCLLRTKDVQNIMNILRSAKNA